MGGRFLTETIKHEIPCYDTELALEKAPKNAFAFRFFEIEYKIATTKEGEKFEVDHKRTNETGKHYIDAEVFIYKQILQEYSENDILPFNMKANNWFYVVKTNLNTYQPFTQNDKLVNMQGEIT